jgi:hypothetical protein
MYASIYAIYSLVYITVYRTLIHDKFLKNEPKNKYLKKSFRIKQGLVGVVICFNDMSVFVFEMRFSGFCRCL